MIPLAGMRTQAAADEYLAASHTAWGLSESELVFNPSSVAVLSDEGHVFSWQVMGGVSYAFSDTLSVYGNYRYRTADDMEFSASLLPARFNIDVEPQSLDIGIRYGF